jgi:hypothetical protein
MQQPTIPFELLPKNFPADFEERCLEIWTGILAELADENYYWQAHYKRNTYDNGCRGPMCRKFVRDASRSRPRSNSMYPPREDRIYDPIIDFYKIVALKLVTEQHLRLQEQLKGAPNA